VRPEAPGYPDGGGRRHQGKMLVVGVVEIEDEVLAPAASG
jgi:hypothetical protein